MAQIIHRCSSARSALHIKEQICRIYYKEQDPTRYFFMNEDLKYGVWSTYDLLVTALNSIMITDVEYIRIFNLLCSE